MNGPPGRDLLDRRRDRQLAPQLRALGRTLSGKVAATPPAKAVWSMTMAIQSRGARTVLGAVIGWITIGVILGIAADLLFPGNAPFTTGLGALAGIVLGAWIGFATAGRRAAHQ